MSSANETVGRVALLDQAVGDFERVVAEFLDAVGAPAYRGRQLRQWLYERTPESFDAMRDLPAALRAQLAERFVLHPLAYRLDQRSSDGTRKFLWDLCHRGDTVSGAVESVLIPDGDRVTYCISTQVGCPVMCTFCATGYGGYRGNLSAGEIVDQVVSMGRRSGLAPTNIVYMGMGEPLLSWDAVSRSLGILTSSEQIGFGARRITVSTVGVPDRIRALARSFPQVKLALSLHAARDDLRTELIPLNRKYSLDEVLDAVREHGRATRKKVTFEYVVLPGVNDSARDVADILRVTHGIPSRINLIGFNPFDGAPYAKPTVPALLRFRDALERRFPGTVTVRRSRGDDIQGACGQLAGG